MAENNNQESNQSNNNPNREPVRANPRNRGIIVINSKGKK